MTARNKTEKIDWNLRLTAIGLVLTLVVALIGAYFSLNPRNPEKKELVIRPTVQSPIIRDEITNGLEFTVNGVKTNNVYLNEIEVVNSGNVPIAADEFYKSEPIIISLGKTCNIINRSFNARPNNFSKRVEVSSNGEEIYLQPTLINPGDFVSVKVVTANCVPKFSSTASIEGISEISNDSAIKEEVRGLDNLLPFILTFALWLFLIEFVFVRYVSNNHNVRITLLVAGIVIIPTVFAIFSKTPRLVDQIPAICRDIYNEARSNLSVP